MNRRLTGIGVDQNFLEPNVVSISGGGSAPSQSNVIHCYRNDGDCSPAPFRIPSVVLLGLVQSPSPLRWFCSSAGEAWYLGLCFGRFKEMKMVARFLALSLLFPCTLYASSPENGAHGFTIQKVLSAPFPTDLTSSPAKGRFAWVFNAEGKRNIWIAEPASDGKEYSTRALTAYADDDGQETGEISWAPDGESIVYVRGGDFEFIDRPNPNPASSSQEVEQAIWAVSLNGAKPRKLAEGHSPAVSPKGDVVAYIDHGQIWQVQLDGTEKPQQIIHATHASTSLRWSPSGDMLAFVSLRGDHSFIGVYAFETKSLEYLDPSVDRDLEPVWSPDSRNVAFLRIPARKDGIIFEPMRTGSPWSIRVAATKGGAGHEVWKASEGPGSVYNRIVAENQLLWGAGDRLVFAWEREGWAHLYFVPIDGGTATALTPGAFEVEHVSMSSDRKTVVYSSNQDDIDRRHVWRVAVDGGKPQALTSGTGIETAPVISSNNQSVAVLHSDARSPMQPAIISQSGEIRDIAQDAIPADFPANQLVVPQQVMFAASDGMRIHGQLFVPPNAGDGKRHPAVVFFHGGSDRQMLLGWHYMPYYSNAYGMNQYLANQGYVVLSVNYRGGIGYGLDFREALNYGATGASEFYDSLGAARYLQNRSDVDPHRIGVWGGSYGGFMTALSLARASDLYAAGVDMHGVHDWNVQIHSSRPSYDPLARPDTARLAWESSPLSSIKTWHSPVLLVMGDDDRDVPFAETVDLAEALRKQRVEFEQLILPDEVHGFLLHRSWITVYSTAADFLDRHLVKAEAASGQTK